MEKFVGKIYHNLLTKKFLGVFIYICQISGTLCMFDLLLKLIHSLILFYILVYVILKKKLTRI
jgi:hypothetical protein